MHAIDDVIKIGDIFSGSIHLIKNQPMHTCTICNSTVYLSVIPVKVSRAVKAACLFDSYMYIPMINDALMLDKYIHRCTLYKYRHAKLTS